MTASCRRRARRSPNRPATGPASARSASAWPSPACWPRCCFGALATGADGRGSPSPRRPAARGSAINGRVGAIAVRRAGRRRRRRRCSCRPPRAGSAWLLGRRHRRRRALVPAAGRSRPAPAGLNFMPLVDIVARHVPCAALPLIFGALAGVLCERSGVVNVAIEGQLLIGRVRRRARRHDRRQRLGRACRRRASAACSSRLLLAVLRHPLPGRPGRARHRAQRVRARPDRLPLRAADAAERRARTTSRRAFPDVGDPAAVEDPGPRAGAVHGQHLPVPGADRAGRRASTSALFRTRWGLRTRAVGEHPAAADTVGIKVLGLRYRNVLLGGVVAGIGGAYFTLGWSTTSFNKNMTAARASSRWPR